MIDTLTKAGFVRYISNVISKGKSYNFHNHSKPTGIFQVYQKLHAKSINGILENKKIQDHTSKIINSAIQSFPVMVTFLVAYDTEKSTFKTKEILDQKWKLYIDNVSTCLNNQLPVLFGESFYAPTDNDSSPTINLLEKNKSFNVNEHGFSFSGYLLACSILSGLRHNQPLKEALYTFLKSPSVKDLKKLYKITSQKKSP